MVVRERSHWVTLATAVTSVTVHIVKFSLWGKTIKRMLVTCPKAVDDPSERLGGLFGIDFGMIIWGTPSEA